MESKTVEPEEFDSQKLEASDALCQKIEEEIKFLRGKERELRLVRMRMDDNGEVNQVTLQADDEMYRLSEVAPGNVSRTVFRDPPPEGETTDTPYYVEEGREGSDGRDGEKGTGGENGEGEASKGESKKKHNQDGDRKGPEASLEDEQEGETVTEGGTKGEQTPIKVPPLPAVGYAGMLAVAFFMAGFVTYALFNGLTNPMVGVVRWSYEGGRLTLVAGWLAAFTFTGAGIGFYIGRK